MRRPPFFFFPSLFSRLTYSLSSTVLSLVAEAGGLTPLPVWGLRCGFITNTHVARCNYPLTGKSVSGTRCRIVQSCQHADCQSVNRKLTRMKGMRCGGVGRKKKTHEFLHNTFLVGKRIAAGMTRRNTQRAASSSCTSAPSPLQHACEVGWGGVGGGTC